ncbi:PspC domain-containing protein [Rhodococcus sp. ABRD24]|uniref:PspC domain-containing protein n=1 Tax=Rhodococcus sp. ABRD24 TaxID=2507582 RepID=UPI00103E2FD7|nr:PspC domain-containing protein [Rhodococcus sp. ABRD24]QBJ95450.1 PspC domain-containing protein [Rhodococcus sp. ABRD24]
MVRRQSDRDDGSMSTERTTGSFTDQLHDLWRTRPVRLPVQGHIAGVAAGIGHRYRVDPVLVRVAFVVSTIFGGAGIVLYLAGWLLLSKPGDQVSPAESLLGRGQSSQSGTKTVVLLVALAIAMSTLGPIGIGMGGSGLISFALMLGGLWLLFQRQPVPPPLPAGTPQGFPVTPFQTVSAATFPGQAYSPYTLLPDHYEPSPTPAPAPAPAQPQAPNAEATAQPYPTPPAWDPLGVAPFAWDLPDPATPPGLPAELPRKRTRFTSVILGLAVLAAAAAAAVSAAVGSEWLSPGRIGAISLAVVGIGLVLGGFLRRGYGLLVVTGPLIGFVVLASLVGPLNFDATGQQRWFPATAAELQSSYSGGFGDFTLDLSMMKLTKDTTVEVDTKFGEFNVIVPPTMSVENICTVTLGDASGCLDSGVHRGTNAPDGSPVLTVKAHGTMGSVGVQHG